MDGEDYIQTLTFPRADKDQEREGWTLDPDFLMDVANKANITPEAVQGVEVGLEEVEIVLLAVEALRRGNKS